MNVRTFTADIDLAKNDSQIGGLSDRVGSAVNTADGHSQHRVSLHVQEVESASAKHGLLNVQMRNMTESVDNPFRMKRQTTSRTPEGRSATCGVQGFCFFFCFSLSFSNFLDLNGCTISFDIFDKNIFF